MTIFFECLKQTAVDYIPDVVADAAAGVATYWMDSGLFMRTVTVIATAPAATWAAGCTESAAHAIFNLFTAPVNAAVSGKEGFYTNLSRAKQHSYAAVGTGTLAVLSAIPVVGTLIGYSYIYKESKDFLNKKCTIEEAKKDILRNQDPYICEEVCRPDLTQERLNELITTIEHIRKHGLQITEADTSLQQRHLSNTLVDRYYLYTGCYYACVMACNSSAFFFKTIEKAYQLTTWLLSCRYIKKTVIFTAQAAGNAVVVSMEWSNKVKRDRVDLFSPRKIR